MKIKVCGLKYTDNIKAVAALSPDYVGFICYAPSPRYVADMPASVLDELPSGIYKTAVFVNEDEKTIGDLVDTFGFDAVQLHGNEDADFAGSLKEKAIVLKAFGLHPGFDFGKLDEYEGKVDYFLFDTKTDLHGGSGKTFDWTILDDYTLNTPFFLSGGLSLDNLHEVRAIQHPMFYGVDLNRKFETAPGLKNIEKLEQAFNIIKQQTTNEIRS